MLENPMVSGFGFDDEADYWDCDPGIELDALDTILCDQREDELRKDRRQHGQTEA